jgi:hypothetical protein
MLTVKMKISGAFRFFQADPGFATFRRPCDLQNALSAETT